MDDNIQFLVLTLKILIHGQPITTPQEQFNNADKAIKKQHRYIKRFKDAAWNRWNKEYLRYLTNTHNMENYQRHMEITTGHVVLTKGGDKHRSKCNIGIVEELYEGKDSLIRVVKLRSKKTYIERPIQLLYPLDLSYDT